MTEVPYNKGDEYEDKIFTILKTVNLLPPNIKRAGAGTGADMPFVHKGQTFILEVKKDLKADYGQKMIKWNKEKGWFWCLDDEMTRLYTKLGALDYLNKKSIVPMRFIKEKKDITFQDKKIDQKIFEDNFDKTIDIPISALYKYYESKNCFYIQVGKGFGFYHLSRDIAKLGTPQFDAILRFRFRAKTIHSDPIWYYGFYAVLKIKSEKIKKSEFNLEPSKNQLFPPIES